MELQIIFVMYMYTSCLVLSFQAVFHEVLKHLRTLFPNFIHLLSSAWHFSHARKFWLTLLHFLESMTWMTLMHLFRIQRAHCAFRATCGTESFMDHIQPLRLAPPMGMFFSFYNMLVLFTLQIMENLNVSFLPSKLIWLKSIDRSMCIVLG